MERKITVQSNQSVFDLAIQLGGSVEAAIDIAMALGISVTDDVPIGTVIEVEKVPVYNLSVLEYCLANNIRPSTAEKIVLSNPLVPGTGIGFMRIGSTFIVR